jgi:hypothetical protein
LANHLKLEVGKLALAVLRSSSDAERDLEDLRHRQRFSLAVSLAV